MGYGDLSVGGIENEGLGVVKSASAGGRIILDEFIKPDHAIGVHVPVAMPDDPSERPDELIGFDLFTEPGESREISSAK